MVTCTAHLTAVSMTRMLCSDSMVLRRPLNLRWIDSGSERVIQIAPVDDLAEDSVDEELRRVVSRTPVRYANDASAMSDDSDVVCVFSGHSAPPHIIAPLDSEDGSRTPGEHHVDDLQALRNLYPLLTVGGSVN
jgi:hypothetical protein